MRVTEKMVEAAAKVLADSPTIDSPKLPWQSWMGTARSMLESALRSQPQVEVVAIEITESQGKFPLSSAKEAEWRRQKMEQFKAGFQTYPYAAPPADGVVVPREKAIAEWENYVNMGRGFSVGPTVPSSMVAVPREKLEHWREYWNGSANERAMQAALEHILGEVDDLLAAPKGGE